MDAITTFLAAGHSFHLTFDVPALIGALPGSLVLVVGASWWIFRR